MANSLLKIPYIVNRTVLVTVLSPDATQTYNLQTKTFEAEDPTQFPSYTIPTVDSQNLGLYVGDFPSELPPNNYPIVIYELDSGQYTQIDIDSIAWTGQAISTPVTITQSSYSDVDSANAYFNSRLHSEGWIALADSNQKQQALNRATQILERFAYVGCRTDPNQLFEWPRSGICRVSSDTIPQKILEAQFEIAYSLLIDGVDLETQQAGLRVVSRRLVGVSTTYDVKNLPEWLQFGLPSFVAWTLIEPYLDRTRKIRLNRVS